MLQTKAAAALSPFRQGARAVRLLVAIPALNEEATIGDVLDRIPPSIAGVDRIDVLVVDDGSLDRTRELAEAAGAVVLSHDVNRGVGAALHTALAHAIERGYDLVATLDADGQFSPEDLPTLVSPVLQGGAHFATASRFKDPELTPEMPKVKLWGNHAMSALISLLAGKRFWDVSCGMRCYSREAALQLQLMGDFTYTQEAVLSLSYKGFRTAEIPVRIQGVRSHGKSRVAGNLWRYAARASAIILRCARDHRPMLVFGSATALLGLAALGLSVFVALHYARTGAFTPHKWAAFAAGVFGVLSLVCGQLAILGDLLNRHRTYHEEVLYLLRRQQNGGRGTETEV